NVFAYQGDLSHAAKAIDLADQVRKEVFHEPENGEHSGWRRSTLGDLYLATGGPTASLRQVWQSAAEEGRMVSAEPRTHAAPRGGVRATWPTRGGTGGVPGSVEPVEVRGPVAPPLHQAGGAGFG